MYWYAAGAVLCGIAARNMKRKVSGEKKFYEALLILTGGFLLAMVLWKIDMGQADQKKVLRNRPGQGLEERTYEVSAEGILEKYLLQVQIEERKLTKKEKEKYFEQAKQELDQVILGENTAKEKITESLNLPAVLQNGAVEAEYSFSDYEVFDPEGKLSQEVTEPVMVEVTAELTCQEETCLYRFFLQAVPKGLSEKEQYQKELEELIAAENKEAGKDYLKLPETLAGKPLIWKEQKENRSLIAVFLGIAGAIGVFLIQEEEKKRKESERRRQMLLDYPEIVSKLSLLLGAGMSIFSAWEKIAETYRKKREKKEIKKRYAYEEMLTVLYEIQSGTGELQAFENFGERCHLGEYRKLSSLILQNVRKGAKGMQQLLEEEEREAFEQRKAIAKKAGEEAGTKLLLPMGIMLVIVLVILILPAGISLNG
ncbi:MAG: hypothetical protein HFH41_07450 [Lachnospiraceae bacterium]|nr:hypothetical protein [Lachnospiraceae bacterium]